MLRLLKNTSVLKNSARVLANNVAAANFASMPEPKTNPEILYTGKSGNFDFKVKKRSNLFLAFSKLYLQPRKNCIKNWSSKRAFKCGCCSIQVLRICKSSGILRRIKLSSKDFTLLSTSNLRNEPPKPYILSKSIGLPGLNCSSVP
ncbi:hypothetical protein FF38_09815 [Lucilia cuprina]|uniref:Uncharacterized protein n=1 Tax=Lucilia cuprina TaxID=7375 RepID=A0A0L0BNU4_LUCCU|nr:hypothetical protein FF38_09815 [Lucilia cuprina]